MLPSEADAIEREKWLSAGSEITTMLLQGSPEEDVLEHIVTVARDIADAETAGLVLPGLRGELVMEIVHGWNAHELLGLVMPREGLSWTALRTGKAKIIPSLAKARNLSHPEMRKFGPALYAPMGTTEKPVGVLVLLRKVGEESFITKDLSGLRRSQTRLLLPLFSRKHVRRRICRNLLRNVSGSPGTCMTLQSNSCLPPVCNLRWYAAVLLVV